MATVFLVGRRKRLRALGLSPPTKTKFGDSFGEIDWQKWYDSIASDGSDEQRLAIWDLCDRITLYEVVKLTSEE